MSLNSIDISSIQLKPIEYVVNYSFFGGEINYYIYQINRNTLNDFNTRKPKEKSEYEKASESVGLTTNHNWFIACMKDSVGDVLRIDFHNDNFQHSGYETPQQAKEALIMYLLKVGQIFQ